MLFCFIRELLTDNNGAVFNTDEFFYNDRGEYVMDFEKLPEAHAWNKNRGRWLLLSLILYLFNIYDLTVLFAELWQQSIIVICEIKSKVRFFHLLVTVW